VNAVERRLRHLEAALRPHLTAGDEPWAFCDEPPRPLRDLTAEELDYVIERGDRHEIAFIDIGDGVCRVVPTPAAPPPSWLKGPVAEPMPFADEWGRFDA
jgi:hypothetical protein